MRVSLVFASHPNFLEPCISFAVAVETVSLLIFLSPRAIAFADPCPACPELAEGSMLNGSSAGRLCCPNPRLFSISRKQPVFQRQNRDGRERRHQRHNQSHPRKLPERN